MSGSVTLRFYAELTDHVPGREMECDVVGEESVGVLIERCRVPLADVELIVVDGESVGPDRRVGSGDRVGVYPVFELFNVAGMVRVRSRALRVTRFLIVPELGPLAALLEDRGYDVRLASPPGEVADQARREGRIIVATDPALPTLPGVTHALVVRAVEPDLQIDEVERRLQLRPV